MKQTDTMKFSDILGEISSEVNNQNKIIGNMSFSQVTYKQQRKILNSGYDQVEIPAKMANIYNEYIDENVVVIDDMVKSIDVLTVETKPAVLIALRSLTLGNTIYDDETDKEYKLVEVTEDMLKPKMTDASIKFGQFEIILSVPTLERETRYNNTLMGALAQFKNKRNLDQIIAQVADMYDQYNMMKYIKSVSMGTTVFDFDACLKNEKEQFINRLPGGIVAKIKKYIEDSHANDKNVLIATNEETGDTISVDVNTLFFVRAN